MQIATSVSLTNSSLYRPLLENSMGDATAFGANSRRPRPGKPNGGRGNGAAPASTIPDSEMAPPSRSNPPIPSPLTTAPPGTTERTQALMNTIIYMYPTETLVTPQRLVDDLQIANKGQAVHVLKALYQAGRACPLKHPDLAKNADTPWRILDPAKDLALYRPQSKFWWDDNPGLTMLAANYLTRYLIKYDVQIGEPIPSVTAFTQVVPLEKRAALATIVETLKTRDKAFQEVNGINLFMAPNISDVKINEKQLHNTIQGNRPGDPYTLRDPARKTQVDDLTKQLIHNNAEAFNAAVEKYQFNKPEADELKRSFLNSAIILRDMGCLTSKFTYTNAVTKAQELKRDIGADPKAAADNLKIQLITRDGINAGDFVLSHTELFPPDKSYYFSGNFPYLNLTARQCNFKYEPVLEETFKGLSQLCPKIKHYPGVLYNDVIEITGAERAALDAGIKEQQRLGKLKNVEFKHAQQQTKGVVLKLQVPSPVLSAIGRQIRATYAPERAITVEQVAHDLKQINLDNVKAAFNQLYQEGYLMPYPKVDGPWIRIDGEQLPASLETFFSRWARAYPPATHAKELTDFVLRGMARYLDALGSNVEVRHWPPQSFFAKTKVFKTLTTDQLKVINDELLRQMSDSVRLTNDNFYVVKDIPQSRPVDKLGLQPFLDLRPGVSIAAKPNTGIIARYVRDISSAEYAKCDEQLMEKLLKAIVAGDKFTLTSPKTYAGLRLQSHQQESLALVVLNLVRTAAAFGYINPQFEVTDKLKEYQQGVALIPRYKATPNKQFTFVLIPPKGGELHWTVAYCWTLPARNTTEQDVRMDVPSQRYSFHYYHPNYADHTGFTMKEDTEKALDVASDPKVYPKLKEYYRKDIPPRPMELTAAGTLEFLNQSKKLQAKGFQILLPQDVIDLATKTPGRIADNPFQQVGNAASVLVPNQKTVPNTSVAHAILHKGNWTNATTDGVNACIAVLSQQLAGGTAARTNEPRLNVNTLQLLEAALLKTDPNSTFKLLGQPAGFKTDLLNFQNIGYSWMQYNFENGRGCILADGMGLGKTVETLAFLQHWWNVKKDRPPVLIVCPKKVIPQWRSEAIKFTTLPETQMVNFHDYLVDSRKRSATDAARISFLSKQGLIFTTYESMVRHKELLRQIKLGGIILDEAHEINNPTTKAAEAAFAIAHGEASDATSTIKFASPPEFRLALTGTPIQNRLGDLWALFHFTNPGVVGSVREFSRNFVAPMIQAQSAGGNISVALAALLARIQPYVLRRTEHIPAVAAEIKQSVPVLAPPVVVNLPLDHIQTSFYNAVLHMVADGLFRTKKQNVDKLTPLTRLQQICDNPLLVKSNVPLPPGQGGFSGADEEAKYIPPKVADLKEYIAKEVIPKGDQAVVFTQYTEMADQTKKDLERELKDVLNKDGAKKEILVAHSKIKGPKGGDHDVVEEQIARFKTEKDKAPVIIMTYDTGGVGLNLQNANHAVLLDHAWNPAREDQAIKRVHRLGQPKPVHTRRYVMAREGHHTQTLNGKTFVPTAPSVEGYKETVKNDKRGLSGAALNASTADSAVVDNNKVRVMLQKDVDAIRARSNPKPPGSPPTSTT